ncbi:MAG: HIRAN domain-containing protein [Bacillota bacterium]
MYSWMKGSKPDALLDEYRDKFNSPEDLGRFIDNFFRYRLPWAISGYIRIAAASLGIDFKDLPSFVKFLPSMVKFGLPDYIACWAMSSGIPLRDTSIRIASVYRNEVGKEDYKSFIEWLGILNAERLFYEFGLRSPLLEDVGRSILLASTNPLLSDFTTIEQFLPRETYVAGIQYEQTRISLALLANEGQEVLLVRDYDNAYDHNAIKVYLPQGEIGFIPRELAQVLSPEMDTGTNLKAIITRLKKEDIPRVWVTICIA